MATTEDPPSPPSQPPPTASAPGPRASRLQSLLDSAISHTVSTVTYRNFAACFPTPQQYAPSALETLHRDFTTLLDERCKAELAAVLDARDAVPRLNALDELLAAARRRKDAWEAAGAVEKDRREAVQPSALPPEVVLAAHLRPFLTAQTDALEARLGATQERNLALVDTVRRQREEIEALVSGLEGVVRDLEEAGRAAQEGIGAVKGEVHEAAVAGAEG